ncbi:MAG: ComF family protein [Methylococcales bacterium]|nr:ComF family protein [Methylococcales bacterium]MDD5754413.1 ComF family protein [Methylococcales bacterium]
MKIIQKYFSHIFPPRCILCGDKGFENRDLCATCYLELPRNSPRCYRCASNFNSPHSQTAICPDCLANSPAFDETLAPFVHHRAIRYLIIQLKFHHHYPSARVLGGLLADYLKQTAELPDCIIPVPLHKNRYRERGFNQSIEIARILAKNLDVPLDLNSCQRHRDTAHQVGLSGEQRSENMKYAFSVSPNFRAKHVALVDDVMTTGSTVHELAAALKTAGCHRVQVWVCAKAR